MKKIFLNKPVFAWALYDWANSAFATTVLAGFFPLFFKQYWSAGVDSTESTFQLGMGNAVASMVIVLLAPLLGAIADCGGIKKRFLLLLAMMGVVGTAALAGVAEGDWPLAIALFVAATIGFMGANVFYDALLLSVARESELDMVSAMGYALGYLGGGILFAVNVAMTLSPASFGVENSVEAIRFSFVSVAIWWAVFSIPLFLLVKEPTASSHQQGWELFRSGYRQLLDTLRHLRKQQVVVMFLLAYWFYIDGVDTIIRMAVDYGISIGLEHTHLITALLITQFVGFPAAMGFGYLASKLGPGIHGARRGILVAIGIYILVTFYAFFMDSSTEFYGLAVTIGLVQGGIQALSRSVYARMIPRDKAAEFFGFYNMLGKFAAVLGPIMVGSVSLATGSHRWGILSVVVLFVVGAVLLMRLNLNQVGQSPEP